MEVSALVEWLKHGAQARAHTLFSMLLGSVSVSAAMEEPGTSERKRQKKQPTKMPAFGLVEE